MHDASTIMSEEHQDEQQSAGRRRKNMRRRNLAMQCMGRVLKRGLIGKMEIPAYIARTKIC
jgi:hypothetical protein